MSLVPVLLTTLFSSVLCTAAAAQSDAIRLPPDHTGIKVPLPPMPRAAPLVVPAPPRSLLTLPTHTLPPIPVGVGGNPQPQTPPAREEAAGQPLAGTGAFTWFKNQVVQPVAALPKP